MGCEFGFIRVYFEFRIKGWFSVGMSFEFEFVGIYWDFSIIGVCLVLGLVGSFGLCVLI